MPSSSSSSKASWDEMVDLAIHSGKGCARRARSDGAVRTDPFGRGTRSEKISRTKIYAFINVSLFLVVLPLRHQRGLPFLS